MSASDLKLDGKQLALIFIVSAAVMLLPGSDIYTHIHEAWLYNHMIKNGVVLTKDPSLLSGKQPIYDRSIPAYFIAGLGWFVFQKSVIKFLEIALLLATVFFTIKIFKNRQMLLFWYVLIFIKVLLLDEYPYFLSLFLFYLGIYFIREFNKKPYVDLAIMLAGINHPYIAATNLVTLFFGRKLLFIGNIVILIIQLVLLKFIFFSGLVNFDYLNIVDFIFRSLVLLFPFYYDSLPKLIKQLTNLKLTYALLIIGILVIYPLLSVAFSRGVDTALGCYYTKSYAEMPRLQGNVRIVDDCRDWTYAFPLMGIVSSLSQEFEGQYYHVKWTESKYFSYLKDSNTSYVVLCKDCKIKTLIFRDTNELPILQKNFPLYTETENYLIFDVTTAANKKSIEPDHNSKIANLIHNLSHLGKYQAERINPSPSVSQ